MIDFDTENPTEQDLRQIDIHELLPQQEPFVMIGTLIHFNHTCTITETEIKSDNIFVDNGCFSASGLMENIAQTCAARIGYVNKYILKKGIQLGFIGAVRNFEIIDHPKVIPKTSSFTFTCVVKTSPTLGWSMISKLRTAPMKPS